MNTHTLNRRALLGAFAAVPAVALPAMAATPAGGAARPAGIKISDENLESYNAGFTATFRLQHHLLLASLAADEIAAGADRRWIVMMFGKAGSWNPSFDLSAFDQVADDEVSRKLGRPFMTERMTRLVRWGKRDADGWQVTP